MLYLTYLIIELNSKIEFNIILMLEIKAPWDQRVIEKIKFQKPNQIEEILESAKKIHSKKDQILINSKN